MKRTVQKEVDLLFYIKSFEINKDKIAFFKIFYLERIIHENE